jgi:hypothetical protein
VSKYQFQQSDIYQPGTDLPVNRLNIDDADILHEIEAQLLQQPFILSRSVHLALPAFPRSPRLREGDRESSTARLA